jgi:hypothetical protein
MKLSRFLLTSVLGLSALPLASGAARADVITVPNYSFEQDVVADGQATPTITGWTTSGLAYTYNADSGRFTNATGQGVPTGGDGPQSAFLQQTASMQSAASLATVQGMGSQYSLTFALGDFAGVGAESGNVRLGFKIGDAFVTNGDITLTQATAANYATEGTFRDYTFNYTSTAADQGKTLKIFFGQTQVDDNIVGFDNVRLNATVATPEPSTYAMMVLGLVALCVLGAKRKKGEETI